jgi:hypothetical protein
MALTRRALAAAALLSAFLGLWEFPPQSFGQNARPSGAQATPITTAEKRQIEKLGLKITPDAKITHRAQVVLHAVIGKDGKLDLEFVSGNPRFVPEAVKSVRSWRYKPYFLDGKPVEVETTMHVNIDLSGG